MKRFGTFEMAFGVGVLVLMTAPSLAAPPPSPMERQIRIIRVPRDGQGAPQEMAIDEAAGMLEGMPPGMHPGMTMGMPPGMHPGMTMGSRATLGVLLAPSAGADAAPGVAVEAVTPGGGAALAGVQPGDRLLTVNGRKVATSAEVIAAMTEVKPGDSVKIESLRDGKPRNIEIVSQQREARVIIIREDGDGPGLQGRGEPRGRGPLADLELATLTPALGRYFGTDKGVLVVHANGALKLQDGDVLRAIGGRLPNDEQHATRILGSYAPGELVKLDVLRDRKSVSLESLMPGNEGGPMKRKIRVQGGPPPAP